MRSGKDRPRVCGVATQSKDSPGEEVVQRKAEGCGAQPGMLRKALQLCELAVRGRLRTDHAH